MKEDCRDNYNLRLFNAVNTEYEHRALQIFSPREVMIHHSEED